MVPLQLNSEEELQCLQNFKKLVVEKGDQIVEKELNCLDDDDLLMMLIRCRHYKIHSAYERLRRLSYARQKYPEDLNRIYPSRIIHARGNRAASVLKQRDAQGRSIIIIRAKFYDPDELCFDDAAVAMAILGMEVLQSVETQLNGIVAIIDAEGFSLKHAKLATPSVVYKYANVLSRANPVKVKAAHLVNMPKIFNATLNIVKIFLTKKLRNRIYAHNDMDSLHEWISPEILPEWLGGKLTDEEALNSELIENLWTEERDNYYKNTISNFNRNLCAQ